MRISSAILILLTVLFSLNLPAQSAAKVLFFNQYLEASDSLSAKFSALLMQEGQHWKFTLKKIGSDTVLMQGSYLDADMQIADGLHEFWYEDGAKKNEEGYSKGKANGIWKSWDEYERITDSSIYRIQKIFLPIPACPFYLLLYEFLTGHFHNNFFFRSPYHYKIQYRL